MRNQRSDVRGQKSEVRCQRSEIRNQKDKTHLSKFITAEVPKLQVEQSNR